MDSILILYVDRIYRINWIFLISGFSMKPEIYNLLRENSDCHGYGSVLIHYCSIYPGISYLVFERKPG
jgi:hypothetical protein